MAKYSTEELIQWLEIHVGDSIKTKHDIEQMNRVRARLRAADELCAAGRAYRDIMASRSASSSPGALVARRNMAKARLNKAIAKYEEA